MLYQWKRNKETTGFYVLKSEKLTRKRKINFEELKLAIKDKPDIYIREIALKFNCSITAIHACLKQLKITRKKDINLFGKISRR